MKLIPIEEAQKIVIENTPLIQSEKVDLFEALNRVAAKPIVSRRIIPPADNSAMDGFAVIASDIAGASSDNPVILKVSEDLPAGYMAKTEVTGGCAIRIMTGAPIPRGADAVVIVEDTRPQAEDRVAVLNSVEPGANIRRAGEDQQPGDVLLEAGSVVSPAHLGLLAANGKLTVEVYRRPVAAILSTGDELVDIDMEPGPGQIVDSNAYCLKAMLMEAGAIATVMPLVADKPDETKRALKKAMFADLLITSGGVSMGEFDYVKDIVEELGIDVKFWKVRLKPGKPTIFGKRGDTMFFGLPGNPVSSMVTFEQFVRPAILKMTGHTDIFRPKIRAVLAQDVKNRAGRTNMMRCVIEKRGDDYVASLTGEQGSGILSSMGKADGLMIIPADCTFTPRGSEVAVQILNPEQFFAGKIL